MSDLAIARQQRVEKLRYIQSMLGEMRQMADAERCDMLTYMIEMAYLEASGIIRGQRPLRIGIEEKRNAVA